MIVVDTSAIVAIMNDEPERRRFNEIIEDAEACYLSAAGLLEMRIVLFRHRGEIAASAADDFLKEIAIEIVDVNRHVSDLAFEAFRKYGKGTGHQAALNFGDCFTYALAKHMNLPLLYKGNDFSQTDILPATQAYS